MLEEAPILDGDDCVDHRLGQAGERRVAAFLSRRVRGEQRRFEHQPIDRGPGGRGGPRGVPARGAPSGGGRFGRRGRGGGQRCQLRDHRRRAAREVHADRARRLAAGGARHQEHGVVADRKLARLLGLGTPRVADVIEMLLELERRQPLARAQFEGPSKDPRHGPLFTAQAPFDHAAVADPEHARDDETHDGRNAEEDQRRSKEACAAIPMRHPGAKGGGPW